MALFSQLALYDDVGYFNESFVKGKYEDEDFFFRLAERGYRAAVTTEVTVHHYGSRTVLSEKKCQPQLDFEAHNRALFLRKWKHRYWWRKRRKCRLKWRHRWIRSRYGVLY